MTCFLLNSLCDVHHSWHTFFFFFFEWVRRSVTISRPLPHLKNLQELFHEKGEHCILDCLKTLLVLVLFHLALEGW